MTVLPIYATICIGVLYRMDWIESISQQEHCKSKIDFVIAAAGSAIVLGAIWKFPYVAGTGGGGAFYCSF